MTTIITGVDGKVYYFGVPRPIGQWAQIIHGDDPYYISYQGWKIPVFHHPYSKYIYSPQYGYASISPSISFGPTVPFSIL